MADVEMGEIEEIHSKEEDGIIVNGNVNEMTNEHENEGSKKCPENSDEPMQVDSNECDENSDAHSETGENGKEMAAESGEETGAVSGEEMGAVSGEEMGAESGEELGAESAEENLDKDEEDKNSEQNETEIASDNEKSEENEDNRENTVEIDNNSDNGMEVHEIDDEEDDDGVVQIDEVNGVLTISKADMRCDETIELNDSGEGEGDGDGDADVVIIEESKTAKENGTLNKEKSSDDVIELDATPVKKDKDVNLPRRRSTRNMNKQRSYAETFKEEEPTSPLSSGESDIEEVFPEDPLAIGDPLHENRKSKSSNSSTIVVKDTKRLVEIAAKSNNSNSSKKEPTLVIIDTNSILSGRGPVPMNKSSSGSSSVNSPYPTLLPMALPAQGMYPPNMRATITPIPINTMSNSKSTSNMTTASSSPLAPVLPTLTDDMFVVEAPSFIVPYVYEKPPVNDFKEFVQTVKDEILKKDAEDEKNKDQNSKDKENDDKNDADEEGNENEDMLNKNSLDDLEKKPYSYFESPLGKFFIDIGFNLVQEYVQSDLLRQQKRKRDREGGHNSTTNKTIHSLIKNLEFSKENNVPFKMVMKKCEFCSFKTESALAMAHHLEKPHMKNYIYKCNFCSYEIRSPHDILFHMEAEHAVRGRLERAPAFHQCPNCPFEDNQKGKLSRHLVSCVRKFKPEKNLDPPIDFEPPAKIPRVPKSRQGLNVSAYQAMKTSQFQILSKMQMMNSNTHPMHRGRGRPTLSNAVKPQQLLRPSGMVYKQTVGGGSVLVPTNYQLSGNQVYQVVGGQELGGRLSHPGQMAFVPNIPSASSTVTIQQPQQQLQGQSKSKSLHQPSISITPLPRAASSSTSITSQVSSKPGDTNSKNSFVICEICDGYIKDLEQLRNHMQWIHKVKIHPKMIYNRPPLNCQKCQFRFFTDQGLERHLLGSHGLVTSSMQDAANKSKDAGRCPVCGRVYQWKLLNHVARDHNMTLKPAHLSYKCTVCTATFGMYKQFENHVYSAHSVVAKRVMDKKSSNNKSDAKPLKINDEITIIPQPAKSSSNSAGTSKEGSPSSATRNSTPSTSKSR